MVKFNVIAPNRPLTTRSLTNTTAVMRARWRFPQRVTLSHSQNPNKISLQDDRRPPVPWQPGNRNNERTVKLDWCTAFTSLVCHLDTELVASWWNFYSAICLPYYRKAGYSFIELFIVNSLIWIFDLIRHLKYLIYSHERKDYRDICGIILRLLNRRDKRRDVMNCVLLILILRKKKTRIS